MKAVPLSPGRPRLLGITLWGPEPLGRIHVSMESDLAALYGANGAGKTRVLRSLTCALQGIAQPGAWGVLHVQIPEPEDEYAEPFRAHFLDAARDHLKFARGKTLATLTEERDADFENPDSWALDAMRILFAEVGDEQFSPWSIPEVVLAHIYAKQMSLGPDEDIERDHIFRKIAASGQFALLATGTEARPGWDAFAAMASDDEECAEILALDRAYVTRLLDTAASTAHLEEVDRNEAAAAALSRIFPWSTYSDWAYRFAIGLRPGQGAVQEQLREQLSVPWASWASNPLLKVAELNLGPRQVLADDVGTSDINELTRDAVLELVGPGGRVVALYEEGTHALEPEVDRYLSDIGASATFLFRSILPGSPELRFEIGDPNDWFGGRLSRWLAYPASEAAVGIDDLSLAQRRWASLSCALAMNLASPDSRPLVFLTDEPESGLHRLAEQRLPAALARTAAESAATIVAATHSPAMLNALSCDTIHVTRLPNGEVTTRPLAVDLREGLSRELAELELGITAPDLLQLVRLIVIVEGKHDQLVLSRLLGNILDPSVMIYPVGGAKQLASLATAGILWDFTEANIAIVTDGVARESIQPIWDRALDLAVRGEARRATHVLTELLDMPGGEPKWIHDFLSRVIHQDRRDRVQLETLSEPDIVCYLPSQRLLGGKSWEGVKTEWRARGGSRATDLKRFLKEKYGIATNLRTLERLLDDDCPVPPELEDLGRRLNKAAVMRGVRP